MDNNEIDFSYQNLTNRTDQFLKTFQNNLLLEVLRSPHMNQKIKRDKFLDCSQTFSNWFQRTVLIRAAVTEDTDFSHLAQEHLDDEYGHHTDLDRERGHRPRAWDPILEGLSCWFTWKMFSLDNTAKIVLIQVLELGATIICPVAQATFSSYGETTYFAVHSEADEIHKQMGSEYLIGLSKKEYQRLYQVQMEAWGILEAAMRRMAELVLETSS
ncbi:MAG: hypothetical protein Q8R83_03035 [Legionellaceae bacterium]|nr:hypothetical protein [Legionellaceae bacterium]